jgi:hypothetical protein
MHFTLIQLVCATEFHVTWTANKRIDYLGRIYCMYFYSGNLFENIYLQDWESKTEFKKKLWGWDLGGITQKRVEILIILLALLPLHDAHISTSRKCSTRALLPASYIAHINASPIHWWPMQLGELTSQASDLFWS